MMNSKYATWKLFLFTLAYLLVSVAIAALIAYPIHEFLQLKIAFPRLVNRLGLGLLLLAIFPVRKMVGLSVVEMGFSENRSTILLQFSKGFLLGAAILGIVVMLLIAFDVRTVLQSEIDKTDRHLRNIAGALATCLSVSILEETLFRGLLFGSLMKYGNMRAAFLITAFFYAGLHFIGGHGDVPVEELRWWTGLALVPPALWQIFNPANFDSFLALFVVSLFLSTVLIETPRGIGYCIGLHAAWVFILKLTKRYTEVNHDNPWIFLVGNYDGVIGYLVTIWLAGLTIFYMYRIRNNPARRMAAIVK